MVIRVVARIRPAQQKAFDKELVVSSVSDSSDSSQLTGVKIPKPRNAREHFTFRFSSVCDCRLWLTMKVSEDAILAL